MRGASQGPDCYRVTVLGINDDGTCRVRDGHSQERDVSYVMRPKGMADPQVGEDWVIDRIYGPWRMAVKLGDSDRPVVTGSRSASDPLARSLLAALVSLGLVHDQTSP